jgi:hypothetical protein
VAILGAIASILPIANTLIDRLVPDPEARDKAKLELMKEGNAQFLSELNIQMSAITAEANSSDPWTSRARPSFLYIIYMVILLCVVGAVIGVWYPGEVFQAAENLNRLLNAIPESLWALFGVGYLGYTGARSYDKRLSKK